MKVKDSIEIKKEERIKWPKVAIIILNWNGWKDTIECLESVFRNTYPNYQVIVVDNGSTDGSIEKIKAWADGKQEVLTPEPSHPLYHLSHPPVEKPIPYIYYTREEAERGGNFKLEEKLTKEWQEQRKNDSKELNPTSSYLLIFIQTGENLGFAGGNNVAMKFVLKKSDYDYVWLLNNDTVIDRNTLIEMIIVGEDNKEIGMIGSKVFFYDATKKIISIGGSKKVGWTNMGNGYGYSEFDNGQYNKNIELKGYINGANLLAKTYIINKVGLINEKYFMDLEDVDWCIRTRQNGFKLFYNYKAIVWHKVGASSINKEKNDIISDKFKDRHISKFFRVYYWIRNEIYLTKKNYPWRFPLYILLIIPYRIIRCILGIIFYNDSHKIDRIKLIFLAVIHGLFCKKMGKSIDPQAIRKYI